MKKSILLFFVFPFIFVFLCSDCAEQGLLSPARNIAGTWKGTFGTKFYLQTNLYTDYISFVSQDRIYTMVITADKTNENKVNITATYTSSNSVQLTTDYLYSGLIPEVQPMYLYGTISSTSLILSNGNGVQFATMSFTTDLMQGTWDQTLCGAYCQRAYCETNQLKLYRQ